jgi:mono/diheme cytochrome c family protein
LEFISKPCENSFAGIAAQENHLTIMPASSGQPKGNFRWLFLVGLFAVFLAGAGALFLSVGSWTIPAAAKHMKNPVPATDEAVDDGMFNYMKHCQSCHGADANGKSGRAAELSVKPSDLTDAREMGARTDGEIFWQITHGRSPMPAFQGKLSDTERWQLVDYIRSLAKKPDASAKP